jgi:hypothetical protein
MSAGVRAQRKDDNRIEDRKITRDPQYRLLL